ncbi:MAG: hypothetical protein D6741_16090, partial [Planctomycetota bacterium]
GLKRVHPALPSSLLDVMEGRFARRAESEVLWKLAREGKTIVSGADKVEVPPGEYTVMIDCTADWCATCKTLEATVLDTKPIREKIAENRIILLQADWTDEAPEVTTFLDWLGFRQVPVLAIFPAGRPNEPIVFTGFYTQDELLEALDAAGPTRLNGT